jgi:hypothetical protein
MDGHVSHCTWLFFEYCLQNNIHCLCLPPHSTHKLQPLDVGLFSPLQLRYSQELDKWMKQGGKHLNKGKFYKYV